MTIPQADSTDLRSVSDRQEVVTLAEVGVVDQTTAEGTKTSTTSSLATDHQQQQPQQQQKPQQYQEHSQQRESNTSSLLENNSIEEGITHVKDSENYEERVVSEDAHRQQGIESGNVVNIVGNQNALKSSRLVLSLQENHDTICEEENNTIHKSYDIAAPFNNIVNDPKKCQKNERIVSELPLLKIPSYSSIPTPSVSYDHRTRKSSINFPISYRDSPTANTAIAVSSSSSSSYSSSSLSSLSNSRKTRRKSLPQRLGLRYHKIPQDDVVSPSELDTKDTNVDSGILNHQYIPSPDSAPFPSSSQDLPSHQLSFHSAEVHASFHPSQTTTTSTTTTTTTANITPSTTSNQHHYTSTSHTEPTTPQSVTIQSKSLPRDVTFLTPEFQTNKTGSSHSISFSSSKKDQKKPTPVAVASSSATTSSTSKNRNKSGRGGNSNKTSLPLRRTLSLSLKSLNDLSVVHPAGRGSSNRKKHKAHSRSVSTEDLANCRIHRAGGGRFAGDSHPSPGSPSHCCLVSVSRVPMAAATSHLTLDSEYQTVRLAVLGAPGVGKSSIVKQFVMQQFLEEYVPTEQRQIFCPAVIINDHLYEVRIIDCPYIPYFPVNSLYEWTDFRGYGLRNATAYVLVYDITSEESFEYIKSLRLQILESRNLHDVPIFVVGNKHDLAEERGVPRREVANMVKKQWKCGYIECSAKYNWHIMLLFKELMKTVDYIDYGHKPTSLRVQDALRRNRCLIL